MGRNTGRGKVAYSWISPYPAKAGPTLGVVVDVKALFSSTYLFFLLKTNSIKFSSTKISLVLSNKK